MRESYSLTSWPKIGVFEKLYLDKLVHVVMYGILCFLMLLGIFKQYMKRKPTTSWVVIAIIFCSGTGAAIEFLQPILTMYRQFEWADMIADAIGSLAGVYLFSFVLTRKWFGIIAS